MNPSWSLDTASQHDVGLQIQYELQRLVRPLASRTQEDLAAALGYESQSSVSKWINGREPLSAPAARILDENVAIFGPTSTGDRYQALLEAYNRPPEPRVSEFAYDVFLAAPMAATEGAKGYRKARDDALSLMHSLEERCGFRVYYAGAGISVPDEFESTDLAAEVNFSRLRSTRFFVMLMRETLVRPTGVWVEAGFALALKIPSLYLINEQATLPFVMRTLHAHQVPDLLPPVRFELLAANQRPSSLIQAQGKEIFQRLSNLR